MQNWQKELDAKYSLALIAVSVTLFIFYEGAIVSRLTAQGSFVRARVAFAKAEATGQGIIVEKLLLYRKAFKLLNDASGLNPRNAAYYFEFAEAAARIAQLPELNALLDMKGLGGDGETGQAGFYALAKRKYAQALLDDPANAIYHQRLGGVYDKLGDTQKAKEELGRAALLDPQNVSLLIYLSRYFLSAGAIADSIRFRDRLVDIYKTTTRQNFTGEIEYFLQTIGQEDLIRDFKK